MVSEVQESGIKGLPVEPEMVSIPAGPFSMGIDKEQIDRLARAFDEARAWRDKGFFAREQPSHRVTLDAYLIGRYPVTVGRYQAFVGAGGYYYRRFWTEAGWAWLEAVGRIQPTCWDDERWTGDERLPVVGTNWYEAHAYCRWLGDVTGRGYRLPSEAEWEKAARGAATGQGGGRLWPWGNDFKAALCNTRAGGRVRTVAVGTFSPAGDSPYGCAEMVGNVSEWTATRFVPYPYDAGDGRDDPAGDRERVTRGGSWHSPVLRARTVSRGMNDPFFSDDDLGFRLACTIDL
jgi:formylglycine-generating enzyme required for sulfatase activity